MIYCTESKIEKIPQRSSYSTAAEPKNKRSTRNAVLLHGRQQNNDRAVVPPQCEVRSSSRSRSPPVTILEQSHPSPALLSTHQLTIRSISIVSGNFCGCQPVYRQTDQCGGGCWGQRSSTVCTVPPAKRSEMASVKWHRSRAALTTQCSQSPGQLQ